MTRDYIDDCAMWAKAFDYAVSWVGETIYSDEDKDIKAFRIDFASGKKILALSSRPRSIRGKQGRVTIDEAAFHDDLPGLMKGALAMLIWGGKVRLLSSHNGTNNPFNEIVGGDSRRSAGLLAAPDDVSRGGGAGFVSAGGVDPG
jgi:phage FluMu gp28-like protein